MYDDKDNSTETKRDNNISIWFNHVNGVIKEIITDSEKKVYTESEINQDFMTNLYRKYDTITFFNMTQALDVISKNFPRFDLNLLRGKLIDIHLLGNQSQAFKHPSHISDYLELLSIPLKPFILADYILSKHPKFSDAYTLMLNKPNTKLGKQAKEEYKRLSSPAEFTQAFDPSYYKNMIDTTETFHHITDNLYEMMVNKASNVYPDYELHDAHKCHTLETDTTLVTHIQTLKGYPIDLSRLNTLKDEVCELVDHDTEELMSRVIEDLVSNDKFKGQISPDIKGVKFTTKDLSALALKYSSFNPKFEKELNAATPNSRAMNHWIYNILIPTKSVKLPSIGADALNQLIDDDKTDMTIKDLLYKVVRLKSLIRKKSSLIGAFKNIHLEEEYKESIL